MPELSIDDRVVMVHGMQKAFIETVEAVLGMQGMVSLCRCSKRTIRDWRREKFRMPSKALVLLASHAHVPIPTHRLVKAYAHASEAGRKGYEATVATHGRIPRDESAWRQAWVQWWQQTGQFQKNPIYEPHPIRKPRKSVELAEFVGIMMGDGGLCTYQATVSLHQIDDADFSTYVSRQFEKLFDVVPSIYDREREMLRTVVASRIELVRYLHTLGLPLGNKVKQEFDIPSWIKEDQRFLIACIRGLVDTDGCIFTHRYQVKGTWYSYKKLSFTTASQPLLRSVHTSLRSLGMNARVARGKDVRLDSRADMELYFTIIGTSNPKHLRRYNF